MFSTFDESLYYRVRFGFVDGFGSGSFWVSRFNKLPLIELASDNIRIKVIKATKIPDNNRDLNVIYLN